MSRQHRTVHLCNIECRRLKKGTSARLHKQDKPPPPLPHLYATMYLHGKATGFALASLIFASSLFASSHITSAGRCLHLSCRCSIRLWGQTLEQNAVRTAPRNLYGRRRGEEELLLKYLPATIGDPELQLHLPVP